MLNTWTQNAVHRDADRLMDLAPQIAERYCRLDLAAAREKIHADFADAPRRIDEHLCRFSRADFPQFEFSLHIGLSRDRLALSVHGRDRYQGFMLQTVDASAGMRRCRTASPIGRRPKPQRCSLSWRRVTRSAIWIACKPF
jgi:hypothetical protein